MPADSSSTPKANDFQKKQVEFQAPKSDVEKRLDAAKGGVHAGIDEKLHQAKHKTYLEKLSDEIGNLQNLSKEEMAQYTALAAGAIGVFMFSPEFEEETEEEVEKVKKTKEYETIRQNVEDKLKKEGKKLSKEEKEKMVEEIVIKKVKLRAVNIHGVNSKNRMILAGYKRIKDKNGKKKWVINEKVKPEDRITLDDSLFKIGSYGLLKSASIKDYDTFKGRVCNMLQPDVKDPAQQVKNAYKILSYCAIGVYQILPVHHFAKMGPEWRGLKGEEGLKKIYEFIITEENQSELNARIIASVGRRKGIDGDIEAIAADYYSGKGKHLAAYKRELTAANGDEEKIKVVKEEYAWLLKGQEHGYRSIYRYAQITAGYFHEIYGKKIDKIDPNNKQMVLALQKAIAWKETGRGKNKKKGNTEIA